MKTIMYSLAAFAALVAVAPPALAVSPDEQANRASLIGSWIQPGGTEGWVINATADGLHITQIAGSSAVADFECNLGGRDCEVKIGGHKASVSMYYNGAKLVQLETIGDQIVKRRFSTLSPGNSIQVEVIPMTGKAHTETLAFQRGEPVVRKR